MKLLLVTTVSSTIKAFLIPHIHLLNNMGFTVDVATFCLDDDMKLLSSHVNNIYNINFSRSIKNKKNFDAYKEMTKLLIKNKYDLIYTHTPNASAIVRIANKKTIQSKVVYFAHGFHFFKGATKAAWLIFYPIERYLSKYTDTVITINSEDFFNAKKMNFNNIYKINGAGIDLENINKTIVDKNTKKKELNIPLNSKIILSVGELNKNKNHSTILKALSILNRNDIYYIIAGEGTEKEELLKLSKKLNFNNFYPIGYREDINEIYKIADVFCFPSYREGLPFSLMEAMASNIPCIASDIRGNKDLIINNKNGLLDDASDYLGFAKNIEAVLNDSNLKNRLIKQAKEDVKQYSIHFVKKQLEQVFKTFL